VKAHQEYSRLARSFPALRWACGMALIVLFTFTPSMYPQSSNQELTRRYGVLANAFLKACEKLTTAAVDFDGSGDPYQVEWWRCGSRNPNRKTGQLPVHYVLIKPPKNKWQMLPLTLSNSGGSDEYFIDRLYLVDIPVSSRRLLLIAGKYYQADQGTIQCLLERVADQFQCSPIEPRYSIERPLRVHKSLLRKLDEYLNSPL
jgi:hypothetical protein